MDLGADYRASTHAVIESRRVWARAETERARHREKCRAWRRGDACRDCDKRQAALDAAVAAVEFSKGCVVAAGEAIKGVPFDEAITADRAGKTRRNELPSSQIARQ